MGCDEGLSIGEQPRGQPLIYPAERHVVGQILDSADPALMPCSSLYGIVPGVPNGEDLKSKTHEKSLEDVFRKLTHSDDFSGMYFSEASLIIKGQTKCSHRNDAQTALFSPVICAITGGPGGLASFRFTGQMMRRDWQYRRILLAPLTYILLVLFVLILVVTSSRLKIADYASISPFMPHRFSPAFVLPHLWGLISISSCMMISFTDFPGSSWVFSLAPLEDVRSFSKGVYWALWVLVVGLPHLVILPFLVRFWGWMDALIFIGFVLVLLSWYLALEMLLISGLPFSSPFDASKAVIGMAAQLIGAMVIGFLILLHYFAFHTRGIALTAGIILSVVTFLTLRLTLRCYEKEIRRNLEKLQTGAMHL